MSDEVRMSTTERPVDSRDTVSPLGRVLHSKPVRVFWHYLVSRGPLMGAGLAYQAIFAVFAALWLVFSAAGLVIGQNDALKETLLTAAASAVPGLIDLDGSAGPATGAIDPDELLKASVLGWAGALALVGLLVAVLGWLESAREAVRTIFGLPVAGGNLLLLKLKDLGLALVFGIALLVSSALSALTTQLLGAALDFLGFERSGVTTVLGTLVGLLVVLALDTTVLAALFRVLSSVTIPGRRLFGGALIGGIAVCVLKVGGSALLDGATSRNPLFASFAVIIGLLIWFNLVCQSILMCSAWIAVGMTDHGIAPDPEAEALRRETEERRAEQEAASREAEIERRVEALAARRAAVAARRADAAVGADARATSPGSAPPLRRVRAATSRWWRRLRGRDEVGGPS
jgi:membrane protein